MSLASEPRLDIPFHVRLRPGRPQHRRIREPVSGGLPLPKGVCFSLEELRVTDAAGNGVPAQLRLLERWPDRSIRWVLVDIVANAPADYRLVSLAGEPPLRAEPPLFVRREGAVAQVETAQTRFRVGGPALVESVAAGATCSVSLSGLDRHGGQARVSTIRPSEPELNGPLRATLVAEAEMYFDSRPLCVTGRLNFFADVAAVRVELTILNPRRAAHPGNFWELGDQNSVLFRDLSLRVAVPWQPREVRYWIDPATAPVSTSPPVRLYQDSSGGSNWRSAVHVNRDGKIPVTFKGFRLNDGATTTEGARAAPVFALERSDASVAATLRDFWQNFPKAIEADDSGLTIRLFPEQFGDLHELQPGEQKSHVIGIAFGPDLVGDVPLSWVAEPALLATDPASYESAEAVWYLGSAATAADTRYDDLVRGAIDGEDSFEAKRERIDEYGWRNFGDLYADHEAAGHEGGQPLVSHYNNQYDAIAGLAIQFMRTGDPRWWAAFNELAHHVIDIDVYHTNEDKAAYSGGMFWHTAHYKDAGRSTHRSFPRAPGIPGGGPSNEHDYSTGLLLHYLLTGNEASRQTVLQLAAWVLAMDDGHRTIFRWLSSMPTGLASATTSPTFHGPGRGAANSIVTLLNAYRLTSDACFLTMAETLIRRCIHPTDDIEAFDLLDRERRWSYTVFLQALGRYLDEKILNHQVDDMFHYARASLLQYARWMAEHEYPYLDRPEVLEYPNETWAAQEVRKAEVFGYAARHSSGDERRRFLEKARFFYQYAIDYLDRSATRSLTRPMVLLLSFGHSYPRLAAAEPIPIAVAEAPRIAPRTKPFVPQKQRAIRRFFLLLAVGFGFAVAVAIALGFG